MECGPLPDLEMCSASGYSKLRRHRDIRVHSAGNLKCRSTVHRFHRGCHVALPEIEYRKGVNAKLYFFS